MSFFGISLIGSAIDAFQTAENTTSDNIANENTTGASRQVANINQNVPIPATPGYDTAGTPATEGDGVTVNSITRIHDESYDGLFRGASSSQYYYTVQSAGLSAIQSQFAEPSAGINSAFTSLQTALSTLASDPTEESNREGVISSAQSFVNQLNTVGNALVSAKAQTISSASADVTKANGLIDQIASLNGQIRASTALGDNPNTYEDERDSDIDQLSQLVSTQTSVQANGSTLVMVNGRALVNDTQAYHIAAPIVSTDASGNPTLVIGMTGDPNPSDPVPLNLGSGELAGYTDLYNNKLTSYATQLDAFAASTATELNRVTESSYDENGNPGTALFTPVASNIPVSATNIQVGITDPDEIPAALASTAAGDLTTGMNAANDTVNTSQQFLGAGNGVFENPGAALGAPAVSTGTLTVTVNGVAQAFNYNLSSTPVAGYATTDTVDDFINQFNAAKLGVTASFDATSQRIAFTRDPNNESLALRGAQAAAGSATDPTFSIGDSNAVVAGGQGTPTNSILQILGAGALAGTGAPPVPVVQDDSNAFGADDNAGANALLQVFSANVGVPPVQTSSTTATTAGINTVLPSTPGAFAAVQVGTLLTLDAGTANQENVKVTAVDRTTGSITYTSTNAHAANFTIATAQTQTLGAAYAAIVSQLGLDTSTASAGVTSQTTLASSIDASRQSVDGINVDEETQNLVKYQNSYSAAARTLSVLESLLTTAIDMIPAP
jgi:flagellar hook-associated protein 1 FlgK